jgi:hypothetical protein
LEMVACLLGEDLSERRETEGTLRVWRDLPPRPLAPRAIVGVLGLCIVVVFEKIGTSRQSLETR